MSQKSPCIAVLVTMLVLLPIALSDSEPVPPDATQLNSWFDRNFAPARATLVPDLVAAEGNITRIEVNADGSGDFKTLTEAINSIPDGNKNRVVVSIGPGNYTEKIKIPKEKPFVTIRGDPANMATLVFGGTALEYGTVDSATLIVEADYFIAANLKVVNSAPRPDGKMKGAQALSLRVSGDKASFYNCRFYGFQDTICDDQTKHFFKDCYVEGTYDFIFGSGKSIYLNSELFIIPGEQLAVITAQARTKPDEPNGYIFLHCKVTGTGRVAILGRSWFSHSRVVYAFSEFSDAVKPEGWSTFGGKPEDSNTVFFGEYNNKGPGATPDQRAQFTKKLTDEEVKPFINLEFIEGSTWLIPPQP